MEKSEIYTDKRDLEAALLDILSGLQKKSLRAAVVRLHQPELTFKQVGEIADVAISTVQKAVKVLKDAGWHEGVSPEVTKTLLELYPMEEEEKQRCDQVTIPPEIEIPVFVPDLKDFDTPNPFYAYGTYVLQRKRSDGNYRISNKVRERLLKVWPDMRRSRDRIGGPLLRMLTEMHHEELEMFCHYYMSDENVEKFVYDWNSHEPGTGFHPLMIYPNLDPVIAERLMVSEEHKRDWWLYSKLDKLTPAEQRNLINPPTQYKRYWVYANPTNQYELAGFNAEKIRDSAGYAAQVSSINPRDNRTKLLNCINIIQRRFPKTETGCQELRRITDCIIQICLAGDHKEIGIWHDALINAPVVPTLTLNEDNHEGQTQNKPPQSGKIAASFSSDHPEHASSGLPPEG